MRDVATELKELRLHGMAGAWDELTSQDGTPSDVGMQSSRWLIEHLLQAEHTQRAMASVRHQMKAAKFPLHRDLAGFDFEASKVDQALVRRLGTLEFTDSAQNAVLIGGPGTGKTHLATAIGVAGIAARRANTLRTCSVLSAPDSITNSTATSTASSPWLMTQLSTCAMVLSPPS
jgi:DNA replication protein DnaC